MKKFYGTRACAGSIAGLISAFFYRTVIAGRQPVPALPGEQLCAGALSLSLVCQYLFVCLLSYAAVSITVAAEKLGHMTPYLAAEKCIGKAQDIWHASRGTDIKAGIQYVLLMLAAPLLYVLFFVLDTISLPILILRWMVLSFAPQETEDTETYDFLIPGIVGYTCAVCALVLYFPAA